MIHAFEIHHHLHLRGGKLVNPDIAQRVRHLGLHIPINLNVFLIDNQLKIGRHCKTGNRIIGQTDHVYDHRQADFLVIAILG